MPNNDKESRKHPGHINLMIPSKLLYYVKKTGFKTIIPVLYPRFFLGKNMFSKILSGLIFFIMPLDVISSNSSVIAIKSSSKLTVKSRRHFYIKKVLSW